MLFPMFANNPNKSPSPGFGEKVCYGLGDFASCIMYVGTQAFLLFYYTEYCDVNIAVVSTIFLVSRFFDGFLQAGEIGAFQRFLFKSQDVFILYHSFSSFAF